MDALLTKRPKSFKGLDLSRPANKTKLPSSGPSGIWKEQLSWG